MSLMGAPPGQVRLTREYLAQLSHAHSGHGIVRVDDNRHIRPCARAGGALARAVSQISNSPGINLIMRFPEALPRCSSLMGKPTALDQLSPTKTLRNSARVMLFPRLPSLTSTATSMFWAGAAKRRTRLRVLSHGLSSQNVNANCSCRPLRLGSPPRTVWSNCALKAMSSSKS